jgi:hypothetical protein
VIVATKVVACPVRTDAAVIAAIDGTCGVNVKVDDVTAPAAFVTVSVHVLRSVIAVRVYACPLTIGPGTPEMDASPSEKIGVIVGVAPYNGVSVGVVNELMCGAGTAFTVTSAATTVLCPVTS